MKLSHIFLTLALIIGNLPVLLAADSGYENERSTGKSAADKYFTKRKKNTRRYRGPSASGNPRYLAMHLGTFIDEKFYKWGGDNENNDGKYTFGVTYRIGEWVNSMDLNFRADFITYEVEDEKPVKLSIMPVVSFPDVNSGFPLYFGAGAGLGIFFSQVEDESSLSFDYSILAGARFFDLIGNTGFSIEVGLKNHIFLLSDGQHNGVYGSIGTVHSF